MTISYRKKRTHLRILILQGGNNAQLARYGRMCRADLVIVLDVEKELQSLSDSLHQPNIKLCILGQGHTARTLAKRASKALQAVIQNVAGMNAETGLGQLRPLGRLATEEFLASHQMQSFLKGELLDILIQISGGTIKSVRFIAAGSVAGGTASGGLQLTVDAFARAILETCSVVAHVEFHITGSLSYANLGGARVHWNGAAGIAEIINYVTSPSQHPRNIRSAFLAELPPCGEDRQQRTRYMLEFEQAIQSQSVTDILDGDAPNYSVNGPLGNITLCRSGHFAPLHPIHHVARDIAPGYCRTLRQAHKDCRPQPSLIQRLELNTDRQPLPREDLDGIVARAAYVDAAELIADIASPAFRYTVTVDATLATTEVLRLSNAHAVWAIAPLTVAEARARLIQQVTSLHILDAEIANRNAELAQIEHHRHALTRTMMKRIRDRQRPGILTRFRQLLTGQKPSNDAITVDASHLRALTDHVEQRTSEVEALLSARAQVASEYEYLMTRLTTIATQLDSLVPRSRPRQLEPTVIPKSIDAVFPELLQLPEDASDEHLANILVSSVHQVTVAGLAAITSAQPPRIETIGSRIASLQCDFTPPWGGEPVKLVERQIHVLPPVALDTADKLMKIIQDQSPHTTVVVANEMSASLNAVTLFIASVTNMSDVFTTYLTHNVRLASLDPNPGLYFLNGTDFLKGLAVDFADGSDL
ncbi:MAG: hypothetical protein IT427_16260 [Pirellulales bacterium]|nr:hypothetical protein [Pirellulales bacterium]